MNNGWRESYDTEKLTDGNYIKFIYRTHYVNGVVHRDDGPAVIYFTDQEDSVPVYVWYWQGKFIGSSKPLAGELPDNFTQEKFEQWKRFKTFL